MKESDTRVQFISEYISAYKEKIKLLNSNGLFDSAKLFELFAIEVGSLYFGQRLSNLNVDIYTYPCVDLISADKKFYIQVSTVKDIPAKIKLTLENIRDSKRDEINSLTNVKFIVLNNDSVDRVKDYQGKNKIGNITFARANDLITTKDILQKATSDLNFQIALYDLLKKESESIKNNSSFFNDAAENSKSLVSLNIDCRINHEYEIDRSEFTRKIIEENHKNISIQGGAGSGKSALCMKLLENEDTFLYARAERFHEENNVNNIWGFNVKETLEMLNGKNVVFFIDALEFISDAPATKRDLLGTLYECVKKHPNAKIITSCRTSDKNAFMKIEKMYEVHLYEVPELTNVELLAMANKYSIINKMIHIDSYAELLRSPFYLNLIITKISDIDNISDENDLREHIWQHVICLNKNETMNVIESIVFTRAKNFLLGAPVANYDTEIVEELISEAVLVKNDNTVRLKYDIFEDICFEQYFDKAFNNCKGVYKKFFDEIESFGRCAYRRYQIWISNKLLAKNNRDKFLFELIFSDKMPLKWRKQAEIGLVKSRHCEQFFNDYEQQLINNDLLNDFIKTTNVYAFEVNNAYLSRILSFIQLKPSGAGRKSIVHLIAKNKLYENGTIHHYDLKKLCADYSNEREMEKQAAENACLILEFIIEKHINETDVESYYKLGGTLIELLTPIYRMAKYSKEWIATFWLKLVSYYQGDDRNKERLTEDIIKNTLTIKHPQLASHLPTELCELANVFWIYSPKQKTRHDPYDFSRRDRYDISYHYGLSIHAENQEHGSTHTTYMDNNFFLFLFKTNFWKGLNWAIEFVNKAVSSFADRHKDMPIYEIYFSENNTKKAYWGSVNMWLVTTQEYEMPIIISDLIYSLKQNLLYLIKNDVIENKEMVKFAGNVSKRIYEKSNNITFLTIIADIGMEFKDKLPGYALDLLSNIDIVRDDLARKALLTKNPVKEMLGNQILMTFGIPNSLPDRYGNKKGNTPYGLMDYFIECQLYGSDETKIKCHVILDYLYAIVPNDAENALNYLRIQKMDLRAMKPIKISDDITALIPTPTGEAKKVADEYAKQQQPENELALFIKNCSEKLSNKKFELDECLDSIERLLEAREKCIVKSCYENIIISLIIFALKNQTLDCDTRAKLCKIWIDGINGYFSMDGIIYDYRLSAFLFSQIEEDVCDGVKNQLKRLVLNLLLHDHSHGVITKITYFAKQYLITNDKLAMSVFNTIIKLAEDEMNHQKFNFEFIKKRHPDKSAEFLPNTQPKLNHIDNYIEREKEAKYQSKKEVIIEKYLLKDDELDLSNFDVDNYDVTTLCQIVNSGLSLDNTAFCGVVKTLVAAMIGIWKVHDRNYNSHEILNVYSLSDARQFFHRELLKNEAQTSIVFDILFRDIDFSQFTQDTIEFYHDIFGELLAEYFDAHSDVVRRENCERIIHSLETEVVEVEVKNVRNALYKSLTLSPTRYGGSGDWSKCPSGYSYRDKMFLNDLFSKYGKYHVNDMIATLYKLHLNKLLPEILLSVKDVFQSVIGTDVDDLRKTKLSDELKEGKNIVLSMITIAFFDFGDQIKQDDALTSAFEDVLEMLLEINYEEAAILLDEFRIH